MKLSGWWPLTVGAIVGGVSAYIMSRGGKLGLFLFVGVAMFVYGLIRLYMDRGLSKDKISERARLERELPSNNPRNYNLSSIPRVCGMCSTKNNPRANYCGHCGHRL